MNTGRSTGVRWLAWLAWLALVASLLAAAPGAAQAQDNTGSQQDDGNGGDQDDGDDDQDDGDGDQDDTATDPLTNAPFITSAGPGEVNPHTAIVVTWEWSFAVDPNVPTADGVEHDYSYQVQISRDMEGQLTPWFDYLDTTAVQVAEEFNVDSATGARELKLSGTLTHGQLWPQDTFHYRIRVRDGQAPGPWATVGPVSPKPLPAPAAPTDFTAVPSPDDPQRKILFNWTAPPEAATDQVFYRIGLRDAETETWTSVNEIRGTTYSLDLAAPFQFDQYELRAVLSHGGLGIAASEAAKALVTPSQPPAPTGVTGTAHSRTPSSAVTIRWSAVPDEAGSAVKYELRSRRSGSGDSGWQVAVTGWIETGFNHGWRTPATTYEYQVRASREGSSTTQFSDWSETATVTTGKEIGGL